MPAKTCYWFLYKNERRAYNVWTMGWLVLNTVRHLGKQSFDLHGTSKSGVCCWANCLGAMMNIFWYGWALASNYFNPCMQKPLENTQKWFPNKSKVSIEKFQSLVHSSSRQLLLSLGLWGSGSCSLDWLHRQSKAYIDSKTFVTCDFWELPKRFYRILEKTVLFFSSL